MRKPFSKAKLVFIPTAANISSRDKKWLINDLNNCAKLGFGKINILNIDATPQSRIWRPRLEEADVILFGGGDTSYLLHWIRKSGIDKALPRLLKMRVYVGISAGSIVAGPDLSLLKMYYGEEPRREKALRLVSLHFRPHFSSPHFPKARTKYLTRLAKKLRGPMYALDDNSALEVINDKIKVITEGKYLFVDA